MSLEELQRVSGIGVSAARLLTNHGIPTLRSLADSPLEAIVAVPGFGQIRAGRVQSAAAALLASAEPTGSAPRTQGVAGAGKKRKKSKKKDKGKKRKTGKKKGKKGKKKGKGKKKSKKKSKKKGKKKSKK